MFMNITYLLTYLLTYLPSLMNGNTLLRISHANISLNNGNDDDDDDDDDDDASLQS